MRVLTIAELKNYQTGAEVRLPADVLVTAAAMDYAREKGITFVQEDAAVQPETAQMVRAITKVAAEKLGPSATPEKLKEVVGDVMKRVEHLPKPPTAQSVQQEVRSGNRIIVTVLGKDRVGIIAALAAVLAEENVNILDLSQTIQNGFFTLNMTADISEQKHDFAYLKERLDEVGRKMGVKVVPQREEVFLYMHRI